MSELLKKEKEIKIVCLILITIGILIAIGLYVVKEVIYIDAYISCVKHWESKAGCLKYINTSTDIDWLRMP